MSNAEDPATPAAVLNRRALLEKTGVAVVVLGAGPAFLAACGSNGDGETGTVGGSLDFLAWQGYDSPDAMKAWKTKHDVKVRPTYISTQEDVQAKLKAGGTGADIAIYQNGFGPFYNELGILEAIDESQVPNLENLFPVFGSSEGNWWINADGDRIGVPFTWGALTITYDSALEPEPTTYEVLFEPRLKGQVTVIDDPITVYALAAHVLGRDVTRLDESGFAEVNNWVTDLAAQTRGLAPGYSDGSDRLAAGETTYMVPGSVLWETFANEKGKGTIKTVQRFTSGGKFLPREGGISYADTWCIPKGTDNEATALSWINETCDPRVNAEANNVLIQGATVAKAVPFLDKLNRDKYHYDNLDGLFENAPLYTNPPVKSDDYVTVSEMYNAWEAVKAGV